MLLVTGDEDRATQGSRRGALSRALQSRSDVVVDLSQLHFADSSLMLDLAMVARRLRKRGRKMLLRGAQPQIRRLIETVGLDRLPGVMVVGPSFA
jgi:anti-anti-sigma factor